MKLTANIALVSVVATAALARAAEVVVNHVVDDFPWSDPFGEYAVPPGFEATCEATATFRARQHLLSELGLPEPKGLQPWYDALKYFFGGRPFPGSWDGVDAHGINRDVILMNYTELPEAVKGWIEDQKKKKDSDGMWLFGVYHKNLPGIKIKGTATPRPRSAVPKATATPTPTLGGEDGADGGDDDVEVDPEVVRLPPDENLVVLFAAGALYHVLPLWVAHEAGERSECEAQFMDLSKYGPTLKDGSVTGWVVERTEPDTSSGSNSREILFKVKAQVLRETEAGRVSRLAREKEEAEASIAATAAAKTAEAAPSSLASSEAGTETQAAAEAKQGSEKDEL